MKYILFTTLFFIALSVLNKPDINTIIKVSFLLYSQILKTFFKKILRTFKLLLKIFKLNFKKNSLYLLKEI